MVLAQDTSLYPLTYGFCKKQCSYCGGWGMAGRGYGGINGDKKTRNKKPRADADWRGQERRAGWSA